jgi:molybdopterin converting factor subunit 1
MFVTIRLFARLRELAGHSELQRDLPDESTVRTAWEATVREFPSVADYERSLSAAVNADYARFTTPLHDGDEVAFLPPVSGGDDDSRLQTDDCRLIYV